MKKITLFSLLTMSVLLLGAPAFEKDATSSNKPIKTAEKAVLGAKKTVFMI
ncbi:hypothetical protein MHB50_20745 [Siminovitchia sp. FSL H7-0308]|uniref:hypothetical protein n=1 Tax=Siminovitchia sp. FSL H7-0308 TaxID=2921432 RepID=UPI0015C56A20